MSIIRLLLLSIFLLSCTPSSDPPTSLKIAISPWAGCADAFIAANKRWFEKQGVKVELVFKTNLTDSNQLYQDRQVDGTFTVFTDAIMFNATGLGSQIIYVTDYSDTADLILGRPDLPSLSALKGKTIAFEGINTFSHLFVVKMLEQAGVHEGEFKTVNLPATKVLEALDAGQIDAGHTYEPTSSKALAQGYRILAKGGDLPGIITTVLVFNSAVIKTHPTAIQGVVKALLEARTFLTTHPDEALTIMAQAEGMSTAEVESGLKTLHKLDWQDNLVAMQTTDGTLFKAGQNIIDFYLKRGQLVITPDLKTIINNQFIQSLSSSKVDKSELN